MKKIFLFSIALLFIFSSPAVFAQIPVATPGMVPSSLEKVGVVAAVQGKIELTSPGQVGRIAQSGQPIFLGDEVKTDAQGHLQILLLDQTVFTIGPNSAIVIDKFVYDPKTNDGQIQASITKGVFRYVSGKIAAKKSDNISVKLPTASIGFRGTIVGGLVNPDGSSLAALLGPGDNNDARETIGSFVMRGTGSNSGYRQEVNRTGFGVEAGVDGILSDIFQLPGMDILSLTNGLLPPSGQSGGGDGLTGGNSVTDLSGEGRVLTAGNGSAANALAWLSAAKDKLTTLAAQDAADASSAIADGITTMEQLSRIQTGVYHFYASGTYNGVGSMSAKIDINFGSRMLGGGNSFVSISQGADTDMTSGISALPFGNAGNAIFHWSGVAGASGTFDNIDVTLRNSGCVVADQATVTTDYTVISTGPPAGSGSAEGSRIAGAS